MLVRRARASAWTVGELYASTSTRHPHAVAGATACAVMTTADLVVQSTLQRDASRGVDWDRTRAIAVFAGWHYGVPAKFLYLWYDRFFGVAPTLRTAASKMAVDVYVHGSMLLTPSFYLITGKLKGQSVEQIANQYRGEWFVATFGSAAYWTPLCTLNFLFVPQHSRILVIAMLSFVHKTWLSWLTNRSRYKERSLGYAK